MCLNPKYVKFYFDTSTGERKLKFYDCFADWNFENDNSDNFTTLPCQVCAECCEQYSNEWSWRVMCELESWPKDKCCFITLTYKDTNGSLVPRDLQLFIKRLRKSIAPEKLRFFACGEYGSKGLRPHYHLILFGYVPKDLYFLKYTSKKQKIYSSSSLEAIWSHGFVSVGDVNQYSAKYSAKYMQKLQKIPNDFVPPFTRMSTKPGLGLNYFIDNKEKFLETDKIFFNGKYQHIPRYFLRKCCTEQDIVNIKAVRKNKADLLYSADMINHKYDELEVKKYVRN